MKVIGQLRVLSALFPGEESPVLGGREVVWAAELVWRRWRRE